MSKKIVVFDVDGVLANFEYGYNAMLSRLGRPGIFATQWSDLGDPNVWSAIENDPFFWLRLPSLVGADTWTRIACLCADEDVYFATARHVCDPKHSTEQWLRRYLGHKGTVVITQQKARFVKAVRATHIIDDKYENIWQARQHCQGAVLLSRPYNEFGTGVQRVITVEQFLDAIERGRDNDDARRAQERVLHEPTGPIGPGHGLHARQGSGAGAKCG